MLRRASDLGKAGQDLAASEMSRRAYHWAHSALDSLKLNQKQREQLETLARMAALGYRLGLICSMSPDDQVVVLPVIEAVSKMNVVVVGNSDPAEMYTHVYEIAKSRLGDSPELLRTIYVGEHSPAPLRKLVEEFLDGAVTREEAEARLEQHSSTLREWAPRLINIP